jgi:hypothetical protein
VRRGYGLLLVGGSHNGLLVNSGRRAGLLTVSHTLRPPELFQRPGHPKGGQLAGAVSEPGGSGIAQGDCLARWSEPLTPRPLRGANIDFVDVPLPCAGEGEPITSLASKD